MDKPLEITPIEITPMRESDLKELAPIEHASFKQPWAIYSYVTELRYNNLACYLVARYADKLVGYIGAWMVIDEAHITTLAVAPASRRQKVASSLILALIEEGQKRGVYYFTLEVRQSNQAAINYYKKWGFIENGRRPRYYTDEDALIMWRSSKRPGK